MIIVKNSDTDRKIWEDKIMRRSHFFIFLILLLIFSLAICFPPSMADVGGGLDWNTDNWGMGNGFGSWGDDDDMTFGINPFFIFYLFDMGPIPVIIFVIIIIAVRILTYKHKNSSNKYSQSSSSYEVNDKPFSPGINGLEELYAIDPNFSKQEFIGRASSVFVSLQKAWTEKSKKALRTFCSDQLYYQFSQQLDEYINKERTNVVESVAILDHIIENFSKDKQNQYITSIIKARYSDYVVDDKTGKVLKGDPNSQYLMTYRMTFFRKLNSKTDPAYESKVTECPNCGANLSIDQNGVCEYCGSQINAGAYQWLLTELKPLSQQKL